MTSFDEIKSALLSNPVGKVRLLKNGNIIEIKGMVRNESTGLITILPISESNFVLDDSYSLSVIQ